MADVFCPFCQTLLPSGAGLCSHCGAPATALARALPVGTALQKGKYGIGSVLGEGGFGITYHAKHHHLGQSVAIKEFFPAGAVRQGLAVSVPADQAATFRRELANVLQEARHLFDLRSPSIVRALDVFQENGTVYLAMEYLEGQTLENRLARNGSLPALEVEKMARALCQALAEVHSQNLLHRDVKPANVMLTPEGRIVLIDFGSARAFQAGRTGNPTRVLTPDYAAPEQFSSHARFGPYTDLFSLGATLYHALTGSPPPPATERLWNDGAVDFQGIPDALGRALQQALALRVADRPQAAEAFLRLATSPEDAQAAARPRRMIPLGAWLSRMSLRSRRMMASIAIAACSATLIAIFYLTAAGSLRSAAPRAPLSASAPAGVQTATPMPRPQPALVPTYTPTPRPKAAATRTPTRTDAPTPRPTRPPTRTATPAVPVLNSVVNVQANLRAGPGRQYGIVRELRPGDRVEPILRTPDGYWVQLRNGHWLFAPLINNLPADLPIARNLPPTPVLPAPTPTVAPTPTPMDERAVLASLYTATAGPLWKNKDAWLSDAPLHAWRGVVLDANGRVQKLWLFSNNLQGSVPAALSHLTALQELGLSHNNLFGPVPSFLGASTQLRALVLSGNDLSGSIPAFLGQLTQLRALNLSHNNLSGPIPETFGRLTALQELRLASTDLSGPVPEVLGRLTSLRKLDLSQANLSGSVPAFLGNLTALQELDLSGNDLSGSLPATLENLTAMRHLDLSGTRLSGPIPIVWAERMDAGPEEDEAKKDGFFFNYHGTALCRPRGRATQALPLCGTP